jgi:putative PIN family toxin of toxin-antitoxin system
VKKEIVLDTNVLISALRSRRGASFRLLSLLGGKDFQINVSVPLALEYEEMAKRFAEQTGLSHSDIDDIIDYICSIANRRRIHFLWRPFLKDPHDDMVLELAAGAGCDFIVTHNIRDFRGIERFGVKAISPREFLRIIGGLP